MPLYYIHYFMQVVDGIGGTVNLQVVSVRRQTTFADIERQPAGMIIPPHRNLMTEMPTQLTKILSRFSCCDASRIFNRRCSLYRDLSDDDPAPFPLRFDFADCGPDAYTGCGHNSCVRAPVPAGTNRV